MWDQTFCSREEAWPASVGGKASWSVGWEPGLETGGIWRKNRSVMSGLGLLWSWEREKKAEKAERAGDVHLEKRR